MICCSCRSRGKDDLPSVCFFGSHGAKMFCQGALQAQACCPGVLVAVAGATDAFHSSEGQVALGRAVIKNQARWLGMGQLRWGRICRVRTDISRVCVGSWMLSTVMGRMPTGNEIRRSRATRHLLAPPHLFKLSLIWQRKVCGAPVDISDGSPWRKP